MLEQTQSLFRGRKSLASLALACALLITLTQIQSAKARAADAPATTATVPKPAATTTPTMKPFEKPSEDVLRKTLDPQQFKITQQCGTEPPFNNAYWNNHKPGIYVDIVSGEPLFSSVDKFDSGSGWPSFTKPLSKGMIKEVKDDAYGMVRTEVRSKLADSHLGHVFEDGPKEKGGLRYCINSASLKFIAVEDLEKSGYGHLLPDFVKAGQFKAQVNTPGTESTSATPAKAAATTAKPKTETALLAGGCFWGMQEIIRKIPGVIQSKVGYSGGTVVNPTYKQVCTGRTGHAEAIEIVFDPQKITYAEILGYFFRMHDPTTLNQQHNDIGTQYRSAIFYYSEAQKETAEKVKDQVNKSGKWKRPIVTEITKASTFYSAEDYHQDYLQRNPFGYNCHFLRD